jgi:hypothetical protein
LSCSSQASQLERDSGYDGGKLATAAYAASANAKGTYGRSNGRAAFGGYDDDLRDQVPERRVISTGKNGWAAAVDDENYVYYYQVGRRRSYTAAGNLALCGFADPHGPYHVGEAS